MATASQQSVDSGMVKHAYQEIFNHAITDFMKNQEPSADPSEIIRNGERKWKRLTKGKKIEFVLKKLKAENRCARNRNKPKRRKCEPMCAEGQNGMKENMDSELNLTDSVENALLVDGCCPPKKRKKPNPCCPKKRRKPKCPRKKRKSCPKKRKPSCRKKRKPSCPRKKKRC